MMVRQSPASSCPKWLTYGLVPVYDARGKPDFIFNKESLKGLADLPLYNNGRSDVPSCKYVATVGYTVGSWKTKMKDTDEVKICASFNIAFVIILGKVDPEQFL